MIFATSVLAYSTTSVLNWNSGLDNRSVTPHHSVIWGGGCCRIIITEDPPISHTGDTEHFLLLQPERTHNIFNVHGSVHRNNILICIQQDAALHSLFYLETALHVSGGTSIHNQERKQLYLQHLVLVTTPLLLPASIAAGSSNGVTNTRYCRYSCLRSWWWVVLPPETCRAVSR